VSDESPSGSPPPGATVVVPTFRRPTSLERALDALMTQHEPGAPWEVVVVDNDDAPGAERVIEAVGARFPVPLRYVREPIRGACRARNRGISEVRTPITVFLDDDVVPTNDEWLANLIAPLLEGRAQAVAGRVLVDPSAPRPDWLDKSWHRTFDEHDLGDDELLLGPLGYINSANGAALTEALRAVGGFDPTLGPRDGVPLLNDDVRLSRRLFAHGARIMYVPRAIVIHDLPQSRATPRYIARREYFRGRSVWLGERERHAQMRLAGLGALTDEVRRGYEKWRNDGATLSTAYRIAGNVAYCAGYTREAMRCLLSGRRIPPDEFETKALPDPVVR